MTKSSKSPVTYEQSGVDIERGAALVDRIKPAVAATHRIGVAGDLGGFGGLFALRECGFHDPILVSATDGVGTKLKLAIEHNQHKGVGIDLVAMCVNDIIVQGAEPLFFLDYFATGALDVEHASEVVTSIAQGCEMAGAALIGGETAEMPDMYAAEDYDLAGFCVGAVEREQLLSAAQVQPGDVILGLRSSGVHSNGFSLVRHIIDNNAAATSVSIDGVSLVAALLEPTRIYVKPLLACLKKFDVHALAHITGGGLTENLPRVLPGGVQARVDLGSWRPGRLFEWLAETGPVTETEMLRTFNCGIGMTVIVPESQADDVNAFLSAAGESVEQIGEITSVTGDAPAVAYAGRLF